MDDLSALVVGVHSELYGAPTGCTASTLRRRFAFLRSRYPEVAAALLPGLVRTAALAAEEQIADERVSEVLHGIDVQEELIEQVQLWPGQRWILADVRQNLVFVQGCATPYRCPEGLEITLACEALNRRRLHGDSGTVKCSALLDEMAAVYCEFFGTGWEVSPRTFSRRLWRLACSPHPLREYLVSYPGCSGGATLRAVWAEGAAPEYPKTVWPTF
jgi:hypothetical protein